MISRCDIIFVKTIRFILYTTFIDFKLTIYRQKMIILYNWPIDFNGLISRYKYIYI